MVGNHPPNRLQQRGCRLKGQGQQTDLNEIECVVCLENRVERCQKRLHGVVEKMPHTDCKQDGQRRLAEAGRRGGRSDRHSGVPPTCGLILASSYHVSSRAGNENSGSIAHLRKLSSPDPCQQFAFRRPSNAYRKKFAQTWCCLLCSSVA